MIAVPDPPRRPRRRGRRPADLHARRAREGNRLNPLAAAPSAAFVLALALLATPASPPAPGPTLAVEDTMHTEVPEVLVRAPRITLDEILDRVARGEARRDSLVRDQSFTATFRVVRHTADPKKAPELFQETVAKVYKKRPDKARSIRLREWYREPPKKEGDRGASIQVRASTDEEIVNFAFRPEHRRDYTFRIVGRDFLGGKRMVYRIAFAPRSSLDFENPSGLVWVDTNDFVIVRQELTFERSPVPLIVKGIDRMVIERERVDGIWVLSRVLMRVRASLPLPKVGRSFDFSMRFDDYRLNQGLPDSLFAAARGAEE